MDGNKKSSKGTINNGKGWCRPAQQGLVRKLTEILHLETCGMQPRGLEGRGQHGHSSGAHSTPGDQCRGCRMGGQVVVWWWCVPEIGMRAHVGGVWERGCAVEGPGPSGSQGHQEVREWNFLRSLRTPKEKGCGVSGVRVCLRPGMYHVLVLMELQQICGTGTQGDGSLLNALSRKCYMPTLQYVHRGTLP